MQSLPTDRKLFLHSENMFRNKRTHMLKFFEFLNAPLPRDKSIKKILSIKLNAEKSGEFPKISDWTDDLHARFSDIIGENANQFGYSYEDKD
jgi:hypothetical protein